ncbi:MAG TPA: Wadjet anti-phage system protein JetA family protein [Bacilli bacterium]|nr:Wadjet anti-phage system protein JetA family protein [Bacilli bacterium]
MRLFTLLPDNFFSILASKNKDIYAEALLVLYHSLETDELAIKKSDFIRTLRDKYRDIILALDLSEEEEVNDEDTSELTSEDLPTKAAFVVRRLEECGWIDIEMDPANFEEYLALPSYTILFLNLLDELTSEDSGEYISLVHSTYTELRSEDEERDEFLYATLIRAYESTRKLKTELVTLGHSIRIFQNRLGRVFSTNSILADYFDQYKSRVSDRYYHPLKTFDSVAKFKRPIISILQNWLHDEEVRSQLVMQSVMWTRNINKLEAEKDIITKINYICDMYETLDEMIAQIDTKHQEYTKASASKILYLNNSDKTVKGHLDNIFKHYAEMVQSDDNMRPLFNGMREAVNMSHQGYITPDSVTLPILRKYKLEGAPLEVYDFDDVSEMLMEGFLDGTRNIFTDKRVFEFMELAFADGHELKIEDIPLPDFDAFILLILATIKTNDEKCFYEVQSNEGHVINYGYRLPKLTFMRKELEA